LFTAFIHTNKCNFSILSYFKVLLYIAEKFIVQAPVSISSCRFVYHITVKFIHCKLEIKRRKSMMLSIFTEILFSCPFSQLDLNLHVHDIIFTCILSVYCTKYCFIWFTCYFKTASSEHLTLWVYINYPCIRWWYTLFCRGTRSSDDGELRYVCLNLFS
jgi:hypothetical protein